MRPAAGWTLGIIGLLSALILGFLVWLVYLAPVAGTAPDWVRSLPRNDAGFNASAAVLTLAGVWAARSRHLAVHRVLMISALLCSALFLTGYITFHHFFGETRFGGQGIVRPLYFLILMTHLLASFLVIPLLLAVIWFALSKQWGRHRNLAPWVYPLWIYVSLTGVGIYLMLQPYYVN